MEQTYDKTKAMKAQEEYCDKNGYPCYIPSRYGLCYRCGRNIFGEGGYSVEVAGNTLITGCPFCCASYCD